jgi:serine/threonine protein kinase
VAFTDGLGERRHLVDPTGNEKWELLCLRQELAEVPSFEFALRERVSRLSSFRHAYYGRVRAIERLTDREKTLAVVSDMTPGVRLSDLLARTDERKLGLDINTALCLIRQLVPAVAILHETARDVAHGAIGPERLVVTPNARLVVVEYALGAALEQLRFSQERYWNELRIALPRTVGLPRFDQRADVTQIGMVALSLILGRPLKDDEYPARIADVVASTWALSSRGGYEPLPAGLRGWLGRALQLDARNAFASALEARTELDKVLGDSDYLALPGSLEAFLGRYHDAEGASAKVGARVTELPREAREAKEAPREIREARENKDSLREFNWEPTPAPAIAATPHTPPAVVLPKPAPEPPKAPAPPAFEFQPLAELVKPHKPAAPMPPLAAVAAPMPAPRPAPPPFEMPSFGSPDPETHAGEPSAWKSPKVLAIAAVLALVVAGGWYFARGSLGAAPVVPATGTLVLTTNPAGARAIVDGEARGVTPLTVSLSPGAHTVELMGAGAPRTIPVTIAAGAETAQYIELPTAPVEAAVGELRVRTDPPGARVTVDGLPRGVSPILVSDLAPGEHSVLLESDLGAVRQVVTVEAGTTASLVVPLGAAEGAPVSGWVSVTSPIEVQLFEGDRMIGTSLSDRIMVSAGRHEIAFVNEALGFRGTRTVQVGAGRVAAVELEIPQGTIALNAQPWAEVWIDGEKSGETPIGNLSLRIGSHSILFRHPELGEQQHDVVVKAVGVTRLSVDMRKR